MNPISLNFPDSFETERLTIHAPQEGNGSHVAEAVRESLNELQPWMEWAQRAPTPIESEAVIRGSIARWKKREDLAMHLFLKGTDTYVGGSGLHRFDWNVGKFEIGYWIRTKFTGQGYASEAVNGITQFAFTHLKANRVEIHCDANNVPSAAVARRCGFLLEGTLRNDDLSVGGKLRDTLIFSKISPTEFHHYDTT